ncbi:MAG: divergent PAP2 family protein [Clostridiales bacterium]|jgi:acid phosphatase family membrane protein YuiD|nr:divergent PAP2 family protein [Clostridiales bacterium]
MKLLEKIPLNHVLFVAFIAWFTAQVLKFIIYFIKDKKIDFTRLVGSGGFPSSHTALVTSLATMTGKVSGWKSPVFALACVFCVVVMYDAAGVRRAAGEHAKILNELVNSKYDSEQVTKKLKELLGHTPLEVFAGAVLGIGMGLLL